MDDEVDALEGVKVQPTADPKFRKSPAVIPDTGSLNASEYESERLDAGDDGDVHVADGDVPSAVELFVRLRPENDGRSLPKLSWSAAFEVAGLDAGAV